MVGKAGRGQWGSRLGFILAAAGSAVGLGNIWKFPYETGENGGGLFVLIYLACVVVVGVPVMAAEILIGRAAKTQPVGAFEALQGHKTSWTLVGWVGVVAGFIILSYYTVVAGWAMDYTLKSVVHFTEPIAEQASQEGLVYRAETPVDTMRAELARARAERLAADAVEGFRAQAPGSVWRAHRRFQEALTKAGGTAQARDALLGDALLAARVAEAERIERQVVGVEAGAWAEAVVYYAGLGDDAVRAEGEAHHRRGTIAKRVGAVFGATVSDGWSASFWALLFMLLTVLVVAGGVSQGIERATSVLMPMLFLLLVGLVLYSAFQPGFGRALSFVFAPDPSRLRPSGVLEALGQAFFSLSLGMGAMLTYGSYQASKDDVLRESAMIAGVDTAVALLATMMMFPILFSFDMAPAAGPGLVFKSMPLVFAEMGAGGMVLGILFFGLLVVAALTSSVSLLEVVASYFIDQRGWSRRRAAWTLGGAILVFGLLSAFAFDPDFALKSWKGTYGKTFFDTMDELASNWLLPVGGMLIALYAGWAMPNKLRDAELASSGAVAVRLWLLAIRYLAPVLVLIVLLQKVGVLDIDEIFYPLP